MVPVGGPPADAVAVGAADLGDEVDELGAAGVYWSGEEGAGGGALEGGGGRLLQPTAPLGKQAALHLLEVRLEHPLAELVPDEWLEHKQWMTLTEGNQK